MTQKASKQARQRILESKQKSASRRTLNSPTRRNARAPVAGFIYESLLRRDLLASDFGDAPIPYPVTIAENGAQHLAYGPILGSSIDSENDGLHSTNANGDGADEDGVIFGLLRAGKTGSTASVTISNAPQGAFLDAWIDFNRDGSWDSTGERIAQRLVLTNGSNKLTISVPEWAPAGATYGRFRLSSSGNLAPSGPASDGEVEDYEVFILSPFSSQGNFLSGRLISNSFQGLAQSQTIDFDRDGDIDILAVSNQDNTLRWLENVDGTGQDFRSHLISSNLVGTNALSAADIDGDGDLDVVSGSEGDSKLAWHENTAGNGSTFDEHILSLSVNRVGQVYTADIDSDGDMDVLSASTYDDTIAWYENTSSNGILFTRRDISLSADGARGVSAADIDGDGDIDVLGACLVSGEFLWFEQVRSGGTVSFIRHLISTEAGAHRLTAADLDNDGDIDLIGASASNNSITWFENTDGSGLNLARKLVASNANGARTVNPADLDGDGDLDLLVASSDDDCVRWYENRLNQGGAFLGHTITSNADGVEIATAADMDDDGDLDVVSASFNDNRLVWYPNRDPMPGSFLHNPGFEISETVGGGWPNSIDDWAGDTAMIVGPDSGITPREGNKMLKFLYTSPTQQGTNLQGSQVVQLIPIERIGDASSGKLEISATAWVNRVAGNSQTDTRFWLVVAAREGNIVDYPSDKESARGHLGETITVFDADADLQTWESITSSLVLPSNTDFVSVEILAEENVFNNMSGIEFDGHFADDLQLSVFSPNQLPTLDYLSDLQVNEDSPQQVVDLSGITAGGDETQSLRVTATSNNLGLIPSPTVTYTSANTAGSISFVPLANRTGVAKITVTVEDGGLDNNLDTSADNAFFSRTFTVTVIPLNDTPTLDSLPDLTINQSSLPQTVNLTGITAGGGESQPLRVTASSSNTALIPTPSVNYGSPNSTGTLQFTPPANQSGTATITVTIEDGGLDGDLSTLGDNGSFSRSFQVIVNSTKFFVVNDGSPDRTFEYSATGENIENYSIASGNTAPRGIVSNVAGTRLWVVDRNRNIYIYNNSGGLLETWTAGSITSKATVEGIATDGTHIWIVDSYSDRIYFYANAATPGKSGVIPASKYYALSSGNKNPKDLVFGFDGSARYLWVVDDATTDKVFCYRLGSTNQSITHLSSWNLHSQNKSPTGITLDPGSTSGDLWVVDNGSTRQVFKYTNGRTSSSPVGSSVFILSSGNSNPQGIADPPPQPPTDLGFAHLARSNDRSPNSFQIELNEESLGEMLFGIEQWIMERRASQEKVDDAHNHLVPGIESNPIQPNHFTRTNLSAKPRFWEPSRRPHPPQNRLKIIDTVGCLLAELSDDWN